MQRSHWMKSTLLLACLAATGAALAVWKQASIGEGEALAANQPEAAEAVSAVAAREQAWQPTTTSIGTVVALRSVVLRNELPGTVRRVALEPGQLVEAGTVLVAFDTAVEEADLAAQQAEAALAGTLWRRAQQLHEKGAASAEEADRARAQHEVALAQIGRTRALIARKTLRAPFRARVGIADVHPGQFLEQGTLITSLQGTDTAAYVDFALPQQVASGLRSGDAVQIVDQSATARIVAIDSRVDPQSRNAMLRARINDARLAPGASVRVRAAAGAPQQRVLIPSSALRRSPEGDHVFVIAAGAQGETRAQLRRVRAGPQLDDGVLIEEGLRAGEQVATTGSFKLRDAALVALAGAAGAAAK